MHAAPEPSEILANLATEHDLSTDVLTDPAAVCDALSPTAQQADVSLLVVASCWFSMSDERYTDEQRASWAVGRDATREAALLAAAKRGVPLLALHSAVICFDGWDEWGRWLGGHWDWSTSSHPPPTELAVRPEPGASLAVEPFSVVDEEYQHVAVGPQAEILARSGSGHPLVWLRDGELRAAVCLLGHDRRSLDQPGHRALLGQLIDWLVHP